MFFQFFWLDGTTEIGNGDSVADAFAHLGYGGGAINALDFYREVESADADTGPYIFENGQWINREISCPKP